MTDDERPSIIHNPLASGLYDRVKNGDDIDHANWMRACAESAFVGECRSCGGYLTPARPTQTERGHDYEATCVNCHQDVAAPGGRILRRSSRHHEMPGDWWERRIQRLKNTAREAA